jgi:hypothetical protein
MKTSTVASASGSEEKKAVTISSRVLAVLVVPIFFVGQLAKTGLPSKYFYDSTSILAMVNGDVAQYQFRDKTYQRTADFYTAINILHLSTLEQWSFILGLIGCIIILPTILKLPNLKVPEFLLLLCAIGLLNIYVFTISKDMIQFLIFYGISLCWHKDARTEWFSIAACLGLLGVEGIFFRSYYLLIAAYFLLLVVAIKVVLKTAGPVLRKLPVRRFIIYIIFSVLAMFIVAALIMPSAYQALVSVRDETAVSRVGSEDAQTVILNLLTGSDVFSATANFIINGFRMLFPIELLTKGLLYIPFFLFQILMTVQYFKQLPQVEQSQQGRHYLAFCLFTAYLIVSFFFEPDFGSWVRHESCTFVLICTFTAIKSSDNSSLRGVASMKQLGSEV